MRVVQLTLLLAFHLNAASSQWFVARSPNFEVFSDSGRNATAGTLSRFEQLRRVFEQNQIVGTETGVKQRPPIRVIAFDSPGEYAAYRPKPTADAYYTATEDRDYIVLPAHDSFGVAAHEYAHFVLYARGLRLPRWLSEGIAELFSTVRIDGARCEFGGPLPARVSELRRHKWLTYRDLLNTDSRLFYAESWALTDMLYADPAYAARFADLVTALNARNVDSRAIIERIYGRPVDAILGDAKEWVARGSSSRRFLQPPTSTSAGVGAEPISDRQSTMMIADLLFANNQLARAQEIYTSLLGESPNDPEILGALGTTLLRENHNLEAVRYFRRALNNGLNDASVCYRYALLEDEEQERALQCAVSAAPDFEDARYKLALLQNREGKYEDAVANLRAMHTPSGPRAFAYWTAMASALTDLDRRSQAESAADQALRCASTPDEQARARQLRYVAQTDMTVRFARDEHGTPQLETTRVPHGTVDFNPFIEAGDRIETEEGELKEVQCDGGRLSGLVIENGKGALYLSVPDPLHVSIRNGPAQMFCGSQARTLVKVDYATTGKTANGLLRGMEFRSLGSPAPQSPAAKRKE